MLILSSTGFQLRLRGVCKGLTVSPDWDSGTPRRWLEVTEGNQKLICFDPSAWLGSHLLTHSPVSSNPLSTVQLIVTRTGQESRCHEPQTQTGVLYCYLIMRSLTSPCLSRQCSALEQFLLFGVSCPASAGSWLRYLGEILQFVSNQSHAMIPSQPRTGWRERGERECKHNDAMPYILVVSSYCQIYHDMHERISSHSISSFPGPPSLMLIFISR